MPLPLPGLSRLLLVLFISSSSSRASAGRFDSYTSCETCVGAGFGWHLAKAKCGGYANTDCSQCEAAAAAGPPHECSLAVAAAKRSFTPCVSAHQCYGARIHHDLQPWSRSGGITRQQFLAANESFGGFTSNLPQLFISGTFLRDCLCSQAHAGSPTTRSSTVVYSAVINACSSRAAAASSISSTGCSVSLIHRTNENSSTQNDVSSTEH